MMPFGVWPPTIDCTALSSPRRAARVKRPVCLRIRRHPTAHRIAAQLAAWPALANLRWSRLVADVRQRFLVGETTAAVAVRLFLQQVSR